MEYRIGWLSWFISWLATSGSPPEFSRVGVDDPELCLGMCSVWSSRDRSSCRWWWASEARRPGPDRLLNGARAAIAAE
jgi:hypothetical protein